VLDDVTTSGPIVKRMLGRFQLRERIVVADRGMASHKTVGGL
jgi:hypothetical protein